MPAREIENLVWTRIRSFQQAEREVVDQLGLEEDSPALTRQLLLAAGNSPRRGTSPSDRADLIKRVVRLVLVLPDRVELRINKTNLRSILLSLSCPKAVSSASDPRRDEFLTLGIDAIHKRCGLETRLVIPPAGDGQPSVRTIPSLLKAVARAQDWYQQILEGKATDHRWIARRTGLDEVYVGRIIRCAFLAPDIVDEILNGRQPPPLTLDRLQSRVPMSWSEQRSHFGVS